MVHKYYNTDIIKKEKSPFVVEYIDIHKVK
jgi:hypothetical protein